ncbi:heterochromatin protein 1 [Drosophila madeirensis]|uniref:Heterochromatin protein 1 n=1 Tax=Drosophila madeirensis TaxID=30013 RepID=A0AAU9F8L9_DROMD
MEEPNETESETDSSEYIVEKIVGHRTHKGCLEYFVKWLSYPEADNTWELPSDLNCDHLIAAYHTQQSVRRPSIVEKIVSHRSLMGNFEYLVKWLNVSEEGNTWEQPSSLVCDHLIAAYNLQHVVNQDLNDVYEKKAKRLKVDPTPVIDNAFSRGFEAEQILKTFKNGEEISFLIKFRNLELPQMIKSYVAYVEIPDMVFKHYEKTCTFVTPK